MTRYVIQIGAKPKKKRPEWVGRFWAINSMSDTYEPTLDPSKMETYATRAAAERAASNYPEHKIMTFDEAKALVTPKWEDMGYHENVARPILERLVKDFEQPTLRSYTSTERKEIPMQEVLSEYFPDAFAAVCRHSKKANDKHNPGERMHWARNKSTDHLNCAVRHLATPDVIDPDTNEIELVGATWRCLAALQLREEKRLVAAGIKPLSGITE